MVGMALRTATPALPVHDMAAAVRFYRDRLGFDATHVDEAGFGIVSRDDCVLHLWSAVDRSWRDRPDFTEHPITSGAEDFIAGTASCRIEVGDADALESLFEELKLAQVLHYTSHAIVATDYGTREFHVSDLTGNLLSFFLRG
jgi:catechol 2,3-dioxygenase-like lactoylglutathione lyase family enzyme